MKATVVLADPEAQLIVDIDGRDRRRFERNVSALGLPPGPLSDVAKRHPETYVSALAYYALIRTKQFNGAYDDFDGRLIEIIDISGDEGDELRDPTKLGR